MPRREARLAAECPHVLLEAANHDPVLVPLARLCEDVACHIEIRVEQLQKQGEVVRVALVRGSRQEQIVIRSLREERAEFVPCRGSGLGAVAVRGHLVCLVHETKSQ